MSRMRNVLEYLEQSAERFPEKSAVTDGICTYTYKELLAYSRKIGSGIAAYCRSEQPVAVLAEKGADTLAAFLGIIESGAANRQVRAGTASSSGCVYCHGQGTSGDGFADCA